MFHWIVIQTLVFLPTKEPHIRKAPTTFKSGPDRFKQIVSQMEQASAIRMQYLASSQQERASAEQSLSIYQPGSALRVINWMAFTEWYHQGDDAVTRVYSPSHAWSGYFTGVEERVNKVKASFNELVWQ